MKKSASKKVTAFDSSIPKPPESLVGDVNIGDTIQFGGSDWIVLDIQGNHAKILRETVIVNQPYHHTLKDITWEASSSRAWLNNDFYNSFTANDRARIRETNVVNNNNPWFGTQGGNNTTDKIFLLSLEEVVQYFGDSGQLANQNHPNNSWWGFHDQYSSARIAYNEADSASWWWLRSPGDHSVAARVHSDGDLDVDGYSINYSWSVGGLRPVLWINLES